MTILKVLYTPPKETKFLLPNRDRNALFSHYSLQLCRVKATIIFVYPWLFL